MKTRIFELSVLAALILSLDRAVAEDSYLPRMIVELQDGSRIVCQNLNENIRFRSAMSERLDLPIQDIQRVDCPSNYSATVTLAFPDRPTLAAKFADSRLAVKTAFGNLELPTAYIVKISVAGARRVSLQPGGTQRREMRAQAIRPVFQGSYDYPDPERAIPGMP